MSTTKDKPSYEELEKEVKKLRWYKEKTQKTILKYLQRDMGMTLEMITGADLPLRIDKYYGNLDFVDMEHENAEYLKGNFVKTIQAD